IYVVAAMSFLLSQISFVVSNSKLACGEALQRHRRALFIIRRYHEPRQGSCLFVSIRHGNRDPGDCEHASVCLTTTHGHHVGTLEPKIVDQPAKCDALADACIHDVEETRVSLDHARPGSQAIGNELPDGICVPRLAYDGDFPHAVCRDLTCRWQIEQVAGIRAGPPPVDEAGGACVTKHLWLTPTIQDHVHGTVHRAHRLHRPEENL